jgi:uncharacterized protein YraI
MLKRSQRLLFIILFALIILPGLLIVQPAEAQILGTGWVGTFYNTVDLTGNPVATNVPFPLGLCVNWGNNPPSSGSPTAQCGLGSPIPGVQADNFSAIFTSNQNITAAGTYSFNVRHNDGVRVTINGQLLLNVWGTPITPDTTGPCTGVCKESVFTTNLPVGSVQMRVEYQDFTGNALLQFQWGFIGGGGNVTPTGPTSTPVPAATGQVIRVRGLAIRTGPYLGASLIGVAKPGISYPILERNKDEGLFVWYRITAGDNTGWVSGRYFQTAGNIEAIPFTGTIFDQIDGAPDLGIVGVTRSVMNLRRRPSERAQLLDKVPWGAEVPVIGRTIQGGKNFWLQVRYNGKVGWIFAPYVGIRGIIDAVPIR